jgi:hypothetical protein
MYSCFPALAWYLRTHPPATSAKSDPELKARVRTHARTTYPFPPLQNTVLKHSPPSQDPDVRIAIHGERNSPLCATESEGNQTLAPVLFPLDADLMSG